ncbi:ETC complex I subunit conserved family protein [Tieghemostelium lacteum]|uniref:NADH dehydrogenase [ubiquinone] iron-sulfur protein 4, mitochondrial n=1 Tax=Tieghemostelium lacteum TaxID=361077 RepID=A0A151ZKV7_TIELA|nr:ETC complex I subunit conserved family protein [Tieghemostelium lacteum]|eukprot:KYQ94414.1 ETC complex I subunit conserved family protein [Tieghemostelium lacteum]
MFRQLLKVNIGGVLKNNVGNYRYFNQSRFYSTNTVDIKKDDLETGFHQSSEDINQQRIKNFINGLNVKGKSVNIYRPSRNTMQTGTMRTNKWVVELPFNEKWHDRLMGWWASKETLNQLNLTFKSEMDAVAYCKEMGLNYNVIEEDVVLKKKKRYGYRFRYRGELETEKNDDTKIN